MEFDFEAYRQKRVIAAQNLRAKKLGVAGSLSVAALQDALVRQQWVCAYCSIDLMYAQTPTIDHIEPLALGGAHSDSNTHAICLSCNARKAQKTHKAYLEAVDKQV